MTKIKWMPMGKVTKGMIISSLTVDSKKIVSKKIEDDDGLGRIVWLVFEDGACYWYPATLYIQVHNYSVLKKILSVLCLQ